MSKIQVNEIVNHFDTGAPDCPKGLTVTGFTTFTGGSSFSGDVSIGGTLTYEDVTNIDSVGIVTARSGVHFGNVGSGVTINAVGAGTSLGFLVNGSERVRIDSSGNVDIGNSNIQLNADGSATFVGDVLTGESPNNGGGVGARLSADGIKVARTSGTQALFNGFEVGTTSPTVSILANGTATFYRQSNNSNNSILHVKSNVNGNDTFAFYVDAGGRVFARNTSIQQIASERRLKERISPIDSTKSWETIKTTPYYSYQFIDSDSINYGPMADEVPDEMRIATDQSDDVGVIHTYDNGMLQARLYVALQTALTRIEALEAEVQALKGGAS